MKKTLDIEAVFSSIDGKDAARFAEFLAPDCVFRFGNAEPVVGRDNIAAVVQGFFDAIAGLSHAIADRWHFGTGAVCHGTVCYTRHDQSKLAVPFSNVFYLSEDGLISRYLIFADNSKLFHLE
jgi:ketosteroid isomerase-like protein